MAGERKVKSNSSWAFAWLTLLVGFAQDNELSFHFYYFLAFFDASMIVYEHL